MNGKKGQKDEELKRQLREGRRGDSLLHEPSLGGINIADGVNGCLVLLENAV